ncbi:MAG: pantoate kinase [Archaeoglobaceae archaeon]
MIFVPSSITCIFSPQIGEKAADSGSVGVGFTIDIGVLAERADGVWVNGKQVSFPTVEHVVERLGLSGVKIDAQLPFGCGFGMSGASALAAAALAEISLIEAADLAHEAEVANLTGLGDVATQTFGGVVVRKNAACPSRLIFERFHFAAELDFLILGELPTREFLRERARDVREEGRRWTKEFLKLPTLENLFRCSLNFAKATGLLEEVADVVEAVQSGGGAASMIMLGKAVFAYKGFEALKEFGEPFKARIDCCGVRWVEGSRSAVQNR